MSDEYASPLTLRDEFPPVSDEAWRAVAEADLKGADFDKRLVWQTYEGLRVLPYYRASMTTELDYLESTPGSAPWHRGHSSEGSHWAIVQEISLRDAGQANTAAREALDGGANAVSILCEPAETGVHGVNLQTLADMRALIHDLPLYRSAIHFRSGGYALPILGNFLAAVKASKADPTEICGSVAYDPLSILIQEGQIPGSREEVFSELGNLLGFCAANLPQFRVLSIQGGQYLEAGGSAVQEIAFVLASLTEYLNGLRQQSISLETVLPRLQIEFAIGPTYFVEIAKFRAARLLIARVLEAFVGEGSNVPAVPIFARGADFNKGIYDAHTNLLRCTTEAMAAAMGGADSIALPPFDASYREPDSISLRLSRNIQLLLKHEAYLDKVADPAAGSYLFETLTDSLAAEAWALFQKIEGMGGFFAAASNGFLREDIERVAKKKRDGIASRRHVLLGVNQYPNLKEFALPRVDCESTVSELVPNQHAFVASGESMMESIREAYLQGATLSDVVTALGKPECLVAQPIKAFRAAEGYEAIRLRTERHAAKSGKAPTVFLFKMGDVAMRQARGAFISNFFGCGGFAVQDNLGFPSVEGAVAAAMESKADIVVLCSSDAEYSAIAPEACKLLRAELPNCQIVVAGYPKDSVDSLKEMGVDDFIHVRTNAQECLTAYQVKLGIAKPD